MAILVFNSGSSSLKFKRYRRAAGALDPRVSGAVTNLGERAEWSWRTKEQTTNGYVAARDHRQAALWVLRRLREQMYDQIEAIGHRVVHGGEEFQQPTPLTAATIARLGAVSALAPLHNPPALEVIHACRAEFGDAIPMVAVFDTAFHAALPEPARRYALPEAWVRAYGIRRYGFHGIAHQYMYERYLALAGEKQARVVTFQLGNGCSVTAIRDGRSLDTSMGYTPLEGLVMSTRCGDTDPGIVARLAAAGVSAEELDDKLNRASGLLALSGASADMRALLAREAAGDARARLAIETFCYRARKYLGAYLAVLGGADAVLFGGGIGEHAPVIRARICADMEWCGLRLDSQTNAAAAGAERPISPAGAVPAVYVITVDEESLIARQVVALLGQQAP